jgi:hypothetical protein
MGIPDLLTLIRVSRRKLMVADGPPKRDKSSTDEECPSLLNVDMLTPKTSWFRNVHLKNTKPKRYTAWRECATMYASDFMNDFMKM